MFYTFVLQPLWLHTAVFANILWQQRWEHFKIASVRSNHFEVEKNDDFHILIWLSYFFTVQHFRVLGNLVVSKELIWRKAKAFHLELICTRRRQNCGKNNLISKKMQLCWVLAHEDTSAYNANKSFLCLWKNLCAPLLFVVNTLTTEAYMEKKRFPLNYI